MLASVVTDVAIGSITSLTVSIIYVSIAVGRLHSRVARLEEWVRRFEREEFDREP
jgi:hypothetical protein